MPDETFGQREYLFFIWYIYLFVFLCCCCLLFSTRGKKIQLESLKSLMREEEEAKPFTK